MSTNLSTGEILKIGKTVHRVMENPVDTSKALSFFGHGSVIYQTIGEHNGLYALKVFSQALNVPSSEKRAAQMLPYAALPGLAACRRFVITPANSPALISTHKEMSCAILMPWIQGQTWEQIIAKRCILTRGQSLLLAENLIRILAEMEQNQLAHCDLSGGNVIVDLEGKHSDSHVALVDFESFYAPDLKPSLIPAEKSPAYSSQRQTVDMWSPFADCFAGAVLLAEILGWCSPDVLNAAYGMQYFSPTDIHTNCDRYRLLLDNIRIAWGNGAANLFSQAWHSKDLRDCPNFKQWTQVFDVKLSSITNHRPQEAKKEKRKSFQLTFKTQDLTSGENPEQVVPADRTKAGSSEKMYGSSRRFPIIKTILAGLSIVLGFVFLVQYILNMEKSFFLSNFRQSSIDKTATIVWSERTEIPIGSNSQKTKTPTEITTPIPSKTPYITITLNPSPTPEKLGKIAYISQVNGEKEVFLFDIDSKSTNKFESGNQKTWNLDYHDLVFENNRFFWNENVNNNLICVGNCNKNDKGLLVSKDGGSFRIEWPNTYWMAGCTVTRTDAPCSVKRGASNNCYEYFCSNGWIGIYLGSDNLTKPDLGMDYYPIWNPSGTGFAYLTIGYGDVDIMNAEVDFSKYRNKVINLQNLTWNFKGEISQLVWSMDGNKIAFINGEKNDRVWNEICYVELVQKEVKCLTDNQVEESYPAFSPDGKFIAFSRKLEGDFEIFIIEIETLREVQITKNSVDDIYPLWSPFDNN